MKKRDEMRELRGMSSEELRQRLVERERELMNLRFRHATGQLQHSAQLRNLRHSVARIKTALGAVCQLEAK